MDKESALALQVDLWCLDMLRDETVTGYCKMGIVVSRGAQSQAIRGWVLLLLFFIVSSALEINSAILVDILLKPSLSGLLNLCIMLWRTSIAVGLVPGRHADR
jgi:hypothetical protein